MVQTASDSMKLVLLSGAGMGGGNHKNSKENNKHALVVGPVFHDILPEAGRKASQKW